MLLSMTGYGRASRPHGDKTIACEIRALNSKLTDLKLKMPADLKEREMDLRKLVLDHAERGKLDLLIDIQSPDGPAIGGLNESLFRAYFHQINRLTKELGIQQTDLVQAILRIPNVVAQATSELDEDEWEAIQKTMTDALVSLKKFRKDEGRILENELKIRIANVLQNLAEIRPFEVARVEKMKTRMRSNLEENLPKDSLDQNRFEQEILFYLEKMDITEEKVRLEQHCLYFLETLGSDQSAIGRTLNFISQEIGREINTLGAKAYDADIQRFVVQMKDELEKIKEQLANVL